MLDLVLAGVGVCATDDIALSVLKTLIGHRTDARLAVGDAEWRAPSCDRDTRTSAVIKASVWCATSRACQR